MFNRTQLDSKFDFCDAESETGLYSGSQQTVGYLSKLITKKQRKQELIELIGGGSSEVNDYASRLLEQAAA